MVLAPDFRYDPKALSWTHRSGHTLRFEEIRFLDISSTRIRDLLGKGQSAKYLIEAGVEGYIERNGLYRKEPGGGSFGYKPSLTDGG